jgi:hypothetical protein
MRKLISSLLLTGLLVSLTSLARAGVEQSNPLEIQAGETYQSIDKKLTHNVLMLYQAHRLTTLGLV